MLMIYGVKATARSADENPGRGAPGVPSAALPKACTPFSSPSPETPMSPNIARKREKLLPLIDIDPAKCINCHACIHVCPVKFCNSGAGDVI